MTGRAYTAIGLGELLWDFLPSGKRLGGAPANFAYITNLLGDRGLPASRIGSDALGDEALQQMDQLGLDARFVQRDSTHATGTVRVSIDGAAQPRYEICEAVAWDFINWTADWQRLAREADAICFGSLAQRSTESRTTIRRFLNEASPAAVRIFDVNLRQNFYSKEVLTESMTGATIVKVNHEELAAIMKLFEIENRGEEESARTLLSLYRLKLICVTRGSRGSLLLTPEDRSEHPGFKVQVADTIGAGDAFTAALAHGYLRRKPLQEMNETANRVGAWVASRSGSMPSVKAGGLEEFVAGNLSTK